MFPERVMNEVSGVLKHPSGRSPDAGRFKGRHSFIDLGATNEKPGLVARAEPFVVRTGKDSHSEVWNPQIIKFPVLDGFPVLTESPERWIPVQVFPFASV